MDEHFQVRIIVIGFTGLIGSEIYSQLTKQKQNVIGINSRIIKLDNEILVQRTKSLAEEVQGLLENGDVVINTAWNGSDRKNRNNQVNKLMANTEIELINLLEKENIRYLSLGSISEFKIKEITNSWDSQYAESKRMVFQYLKRNKANYVWVRIASCFGSNDKRSWLVNDLKQNKFKKGVEASNPNNILNLSSVQDISKYVILLLNSKYIGEVNLMSKEWYKVGEIIDVFFGGKKPQPLIRHEGPFSTSDPVRKIIGESYFIDFLLKK
jgi:nucleoside-diphosphate-sugar epimerase